jgi:hypothetical protein
MFMILDNAILQVQPHFPHDMAAGGGGARAAQEAMWEDERAVDEQAQAELEAQGQGEAEAQAEADAGPRRACDATQSPAHVRRRHLNGEHTTWCSQRKCGVIACKYTGRLSRVG